MKYLCDFSRVIEILGWRVLDLSLVHGAEVLPLL